VRYVGGGVVRVDDIVAAIHSALEATADAGSVYLTFEGFSAKKGGYELLDTLRHLGVRATLLIDSEPGVEQDLIRRVVADGHWVENRSLRQVLGEDRRHHRLVDPCDSERPAKKELLRRILAMANPEAVIQLHAAVSVTMEALPELVANLKKRGFQFATLGP